MSVTVYPQLAVLLEQRHLTVAELERQIKARFGLTVNPKSLYRLTQSTPVQRADLEIAGATAAVLGVGLDDLFRVETSSDHEDAEKPVLSRDDNRRLAELLDRQSQRMLDGTEWAELERLVSRFGHALHDRRMHLLAQQRGISVEEAERESAEALEQARAWWDDLASDPAREQIIAEHAATLRARWPE